MRIIDFSFIHLQMEVFGKVEAGWRDLMDKKSDPRTTEWLLMSSPLPTIVICLTYVFIVKVSYSHHLNAITIISRSCV